MIDLEGVHKVTSKGRIYIYAWRGGPRMKAAAGTEAFVTELARHHAARKLGDAGNVSGLCARWRASDFWQDPPEQGGIADSTRRNWAPILDRIQVKFGSLSIGQFDRPEIRKDVKTWLARARTVRDGEDSKGRKIKVGGPRSAYMHKQVLSALLSFGVDEGDLAANLLLGTKNHYEANRAELIWQDADLARAKAKMSPQMFEALELASLCALREDDLIKLGRNHVGDLSIEVRTGKSRRRRTAIVPMYGELRECLARILARADQAHAERVRKAKTKGRPAPVRAMTVLTTSRGRPWTNGGFGSSWNKALDAMGEEALHFHDARGTTATKLYLADFSIREIAEILAWSEDRVEKIIDRYVRKNAKLRDRIRRLDEARANAAGT